MAVCRYAGMSLWRYVARPIHSDLGVNRHSDSEVGVDRHSDSEVGVDRTSTSITIDLGAWSADA